MRSHATSQQDSLLIVDDDQIGREALRRRFERYGFKVTDVGSGQQGLELLHTGRFDLILLDIQMPGMDGFEVLNAIRATCPATELPVVMITAKDQSQDVVRALQLGANDYITKPLDFNIVLARVQNQLALNKVAHLRGVFQAQLQDCLNHFFPGSILDVIEDGEPVRWRERTGDENYRLGELPDKSGIGIEWLRSRYRFLPRGDRLIPTERRLIEVIVQVLDTRHRAMFDVEMPNRLELVHHAVEDWVVAAYLWPQNPVPVLEALRLLRVAALLTYENRKVSTGILLTDDDTEATLPPHAGGSQSLPRLGTWLFQVKSLQRLCDGLHTVYVADGQGYLRGVAEIGPAVRPVDGESPLPRPCPRAYVNHARTTLYGNDICLILTPTQEIKVFAGGEIVFAFRGARWHLLDIPTKFAEWRQSLGEGVNPEFSGRIFQAAVELAETRHGALFVILDQPDTSLAQLVAPDNRLPGAADASMPEPRVFERVLQLTLQGENVTSLGTRVLEAMATIDGALVMDKAGHVLAAGAILRVAMEPAGEEQVAEGARTTAAAAASRHGLVLKVSEDGLVTFYREGRVVWHL